jgi:hypothetical protein
MNPSFMDMTWHDKMVITFLSMKTDVLDALPA